MLGKKCKHCFSGSVGPKVSKQCIVFQISKNSERKVKKLHSELDYSFLTRERMTFLTSCTQYPQRPQYPALN